MRPGDSGLLRRTRWKHPEAIHQMRGVTPRLRVIRGSNEGLFGEHRSTVLAEERPSAGLLMFTPAEGSYGVRPGPPRLDAGPSLRIP
jgi:hypothetical protein